MTLDLEYQLTRETINDIERFFDLFSLLPPLTATGRIHPRCYLIQGGTVRGKTRRVVSVAVVCASAAALTVVSGGTSEAASRSCWRASHSHTITKLRVPLLESGFTYHWCARNGRVDEFVVESWHSVIRNWVWASDPRSDIRPTMSLGQDHLHIYADFSAKSTLSGSARFRGRRGEVNVSWSPGRLGDHYEIDLWPDGRLTGQSWKG